MGPYVDSVRGDELLPSEADVVIIGGGIIGASAALELARQGLRVVLCEKGHVAGEQSSRNAGWCRQAGRDEREMPLIIESMRLWRSMDETVGAETGFATCGVLYTAESEEEEAGFRQWADMAKGYQVSAKIVTGTELKSLMPGATKSYRSGMYVASDGRAEPQRAAPAIARAAQAAGATIVQYCAVRGLDRSGGKVAGVYTERGYVACQSVILAGGAWSSLFCGSLGVRLPMAKLLVSLFRTTPSEHGPEAATWTSELCYRRRSDGGFTIGAGNNMRHRVPVTPDAIRYIKEFSPMLKQNWRTLRLLANRQSVAEFLTPRKWSVEGQSPFETQRVLDPAPSAAELRIAENDMKRLYPSLDGVQPIQGWAGYLDVTPDLIPYIGEVAGVGGLVIAAGFSGHGFGIGPAAGKLAADLAVGRQCTIDTQAFRVGRFSDGAPIVLGTEV